MRLNIQRLVAAEDAVFVEGDAALARKIGLDVGSCSDAVVQIDHSGDPALEFFHFFFNDTAPPEIYTLSLHDALPICVCTTITALRPDRSTPSLLPLVTCQADRKSTRLNSSHVAISDAVFCLIKK